MSVMKPKARARLISALLPIAACFQLSDFAAGAESPRPAATAPPAAPASPANSQEGAKATTQSPFQFLIDQPLYDASGSEQIGLIYDVVLLTSNFAPTVVI
jgi:hypothetical protein